MENKNYKGLVWLAVVLVFLVLGLGGFIVYEKVILKDSVNSGKETTTNKVDIELSKEKSQNVFVDFPKENGNEVLVSGEFEEMIKEKGFLIDHKIKYENIKEKVLGTDIVFTYNSSDCNVEELEDGDGNVASSTNWCNNIKVSIGDNDLFTTSESYYTGDGDIPYVIITDRYIIVQTGSYAFIEDDANKIKIFDINGKLLKTIDNTAYFGILSDGYVDEVGEYTFYEKYMVLVDNKLYYIGYTDVYFSDKINATTNYVDLENNFSNNKIASFKACFAGNDCFEE